MRLGRSQSQSTRPPGMSGGSLLAENKNTRIWLAELKWIGWMDGWTDGWMDGWMDGRTPFWGFLDLPLHTTLVTSNYEYRGLNFKNVLFFVLFTVVLPLLIWKLFYLKNWNKNKINLFFLKFSKIFIIFCIFLCGCVHVRDNVVYPPLSLPPTKLNHCVSLHTTPNPPVDLISWVKATKFPTLGFFSIMTCRV